ncbi:MAG: hypothetical protein BGP06_12235 [Rhizobiales bacterium 65-9]|nr:MAG: hypothetical protein BGP06_12235 [Rhizobiales bacterium 65-9]
MVRTAVLSALANNHCTANVPSVRSSAIAATDAPPDAINGATGVSGATARAEMLIGFAGLSFAD